MGVKFSNNSKLLFTLVALVVGVLVATVASADSDDLEGGVVVGVPDNLGNIYNHSATVAYHYDVEKYVLVEDFDIHIFGTGGVSDWVMLGAHEMAFNVVDSMLDEQDQDEMAGSYILILSEDDPSIPNAAPGLKNAGSYEWMVMAEELVCATAADTLYADVEPKWRAWNTPLHEFGHLVEFRLGLGQDMKDIYDGRIAESLQFAGGMPGEIFAWTTQAWFNDTLERSDGFRSNLQEQDYLASQYFSTIFDEENDWKPSCDGRP